MTQADGNWGHGHTSMADALRSPSVEFISGPTLLGRILSEELTRERQVREALFLTFNVNLGFFEARLLGACRAAGAAVTVVADSSMFKPDVRAVHAAGSAYGVGLASMSGAFHPKLTVLVGRSRAIVAIGSGNLSVPGWHHNDEVATIITADRDIGCPIIVQDVADWLQQLPDIVTVSPLAADAARRTAFELSSLVADSPSINSGHRLVSSLSAPMLTQLPDEPAASLYLYAPFHDSRGAALSAILDRYRPDSVSLAVQQGSTVIEPAVLSDIAIERGVRLDFHNAGGVDYRHGKLLEAVSREGRRWALTGSANLSAAALLHAVPQGGNCELGVVSTLTTSLYPGAGPVVPASEVQRYEIARPVDGYASQARSAVATLLQATVADGLMTVLLSSPAIVRLSVQVSRFLDPPERYEAVGLIEIGLSNATFEVDFPARSRVRLWADDSGVPIWSSDYPLADISQILRRVSPPGSSNHYDPLSPLDLFADSLLAEKWHDALNKVLHTQTMSTPPKRTVSSGPNQEPSAEVSPADGWMTLDSPDAWAKYSENAAARLGPTMYEFALGGLPRIVETATTNHTTTPKWIDKVDDHEDQFDEDKDAEEISLELNPDDTTTVSAIARDRSMRERRRYRTWLTRLVDGIDDLPLIDRSGRVGLLLIGTEIDIWDEHDAAQWFDVLSRGVLSLTTGPLPEHMRSHLAGLATVCSYRLSEGLPRSGLGEHRTTYDQVRKAIRGIVEYANSESISTNLESLNVARVFKADVELLWSYREALLASDPIADFVHEIKHAFPTYDVSFRGSNTFHVEGTFTNPARAAAQVIGRAEGFPVIAVRAEGARGRWATLARSGDRLAWIEEGRSGVNYRCFALGNLVAVEGVVNDPDMRAKARLGAPPLTVASREVREVIDAAGVGLGGELTPVDPPSATSDGKAEALDV